MLEKLSLKMAVSAGEEVRDDDVELRELVVHHMLLSSFNLLLHLQSVLLHFPFEFFFLFKIPLGLFLFFKLSFIFF